MKRYPITTLPNPSNQLCVSKSGDWISNGHWILPRSRISYGGKEPSADQIREYVRLRRAHGKRSWKIVEVGDEHFPQLPLEGGILFRRTDERHAVIIDGKTETVVFRAPREKALVAIDARYVDYFGIEEVQAFRPLRGARSNGYIFQPLRAGDMVIAPATASSTSSYKLAR